MTNPPDPALRSALRDQLIEAGHLTPTVQPGLYGFGRDFEALIAGICSAFRRMTPAHLNPTRLAFPPVFSRDALEKTDYAASFPQLIGSLHVFTGDDDGHRQLLEARERGDSWDHYLHDSHMNMVPAACHNVYPTLSGTVAEPRVVEASGWCFRNEPSPDPMRLVCFRIIELVFVGEEADALENRELALEFLRSLLTSFGLDVAVEIANDPFFGRAGRILSTGQRRDALKFELLVDVYPEAPTALASGNAHRTHFSDTFGINLADGSRAHTSCAGLGIERVAIAILNKHGMDVTSWPDEVRSALTT